MYIQELHIPEWVRDTHAQEEEGAVEALLINSEMSGEDSGIRHDDRGWI